MWYKLINSKQREQMINLNMLTLKTQINKQPPFHERLNIEVEKAQKPSSAKSSRAGQRRLRTETQTNHLLLMKQAVNPEYIKVLMKYENLVNAVNANDIAAVKLFLENGANPNERSKLGYAHYEYTNRGGRHIFENEGMTALDIASKAGNLDMAVLLLKFGADPTLLRKVYISNTQNRGYLGPIDEPHMGHVSPVYIALLNKDYDLLKAFLEYNADFNKICIIPASIFDPQLGKLPLHIAISQKDYDAAAILISGGAKP